MSQVFKIILTIIFLLLLFIPDECMGDGAKYDDQGNLIPDKVTEALFFFPDVGVGAAFDLNYMRLTSTLNVEVLDTDDARNIIPLTIKSMPDLIDVIGDIFVGDGVVGGGIGMRFLPILEPGVLLWCGYNFNEGDVSYGVGIRFGVKF